MISIACAPCSTTKIDFFVQYIPGWNPQLHVPFSNNTAFYPLWKSMNDMAIGANVHHSAYLQNASFLRACRLLMNDLDEPSDETAEAFSHLDLDTEPTSLNVRPKTPQEKASQEAAVATLLEYNRSTLRGLVSRPLPLKLSTLCLYSRCLVQFISLLAVSALSPRIFDMSIVTMIPWSA